MEGEEGWEQQSECKVHAFFCSTSCSHIILYTVYVCRVTVEFCPVDGSGWGMWWPVMVYVLSFIDFCTRKNYLSSGSPMMAE